MKNFLNLLWLGFPRAERIFSKENPIKTFEIFSLRLKTLILVHFRCSRTYLMSSWDSIWGT